MNRHKSEGSDSVIQDQIVLLTEGELDLTQRAQLFQRLDKEPNGWKQCAIALLEQKSLQTSLASVADFNSPSNWNTDSVPVVKTQFDVRSQRRTWNLASTVMAASLLIAMGLVSGMMLVPPNPVSVTHPDLSGQSVQQLNAVLRLNHPDLMREVALKLDASAIGDFELLGLVGVGDATRTEFVPIIESHELTKMMRESPRPRVSPKFANDLKASGWEFNSHQQFVSFKRPDGNRQMMPVGMLNCRYVGNQTF